MEAQKFSADLVFDGSRFLPKGTVVLQKKGKGALLLPASEAGTDVQRLSGILLPGLINAHCHLELSHFKGAIEPGGGLVKFLLQVVQKRKQPFDERSKQESIKSAAAEMQKNGIVAVGDICNTTDAIITKLESGLEWHNLVEVLNFTDDTLQPRMAHNVGVLEAHLQAGLQSSVLTPHAPYSVSPATFAALNKATAGRIISVHNEETAAEDELFIGGTGSFEQLYALVGTAPLGGTGRSSLQTWLPYFTLGQTILLVHNTFMKREDVQFAKAQAVKHGLKLAFCLCPGANKYIEDRLPPLDVFLEEGCTLVLGTDSYSSNWQLSIAAEMKLLADHFRNVPLEILLSAATRNAADAFNWPMFGRFGPDTAGLTLLHTDEQGKPTGTSEKVGFL